MLSTEMIEAKILKEDYTKIGEKTVICLLTLKCGFEIIGSSACINPNDFDFEIGKKYAREKAIDQLWMLEGYLAQQIENKAN